MSDIQYHELSVCYHSSKPHCRPNKSTGIDCTHHSGISENPKVPDLYAWHGSVHIVIHSRIYCSQEWLCRGQLLYKQLYFSRFEKKVTFIFTRVLNYNLTSCQEDQSQLKVLCPCKCNDLYRGDATWCHRISS